MSQWSGLVSAELDLSEAGLSSALEAGEFVLYYQPDFDPDSEEVSSLEAFLRWNHEARGLCDARSFIAGFERSEALTARLDRWVLRSALTQGRQFLDDSEVIQCLSINLSNWLSGDELVSSVRDALSVTGFPAKALSLECPWRMFVAHQAEILPVMQQLGELGCQLAMDGSPLEAECLELLAGAPVSTSKVCYSALSEKVDSEGLAAASALIARLQGMGIKVVVVGVENEQHARLVHEAGCSLSQGNRFKSPLSPDHVSQLLGVIKKTKDAFRIL